VLDNLSEERDGLWWKTMEMGQRSYPVFAHCNTFSLESVDENDFFLTTML
jgi:hypothetical protein